MQHDIHVYTMSMTKNNESMSIESTQNSYHHGNLRSELLKVGFEVLNHKNSDEFSLREVARKAGVSATSVYRHFSNKQALVKALCAEGAQVLALALRTAMKNGGGAQQGLDESGMAYVRFAIDNPALFRLMVKTRPGYGDTESPSMQELLTNVATLLPKNATPEEKQIRAYQAWSIVHGVTMLVLEGQLENDEQLIKAIIRTPGT